jgi:predicted PurR-regulated permease PerM
VALHYFQHNNNDVSRALEVSIHVGLLILLATGCLFILRPFLPLILWGIIIAIAAYPIYRGLGVVALPRFSSAFVCSAS